MITPEHTPTIPTKNWGQQRPIIVLKIFIRYLRMEDVVYAMAGRNRMSDHGLIEFTVSIYLKRLA